MENVRFVVVSDTPSLESSQVTGMWIKRFKKKKYFVINIICCVCVCYLIKFPPVNMFMKVLSPPFMCQSSIILLYCNSIIPSQEYTKVWRERIGSIKRHQDSNQRKGECVLWHGSVFAKEEWVRTYKYPLFCAWLIGLLMSNVDCLFFSLYLNLVLGNVNVTLLSNQAKYVNLPEMSIILSNMSNIFLDYGK